MMKVGLTKVQERAIELVGTGLNDYDVCLVASINVHTLRSWKNPKHRGFNDIFTERYKLAAIKSGNERLLRQREKRAEKLLSSELGVNKNGKVFNNGQGKWSEEVGKKLIKLVGCGMTQKEICKDVGISASTLCSWKNSKNSAYKKEFAELYEYAYKYEGGDALESEAKAIADDNSLDMYEENNKFGIVSRPNSVSVLRARLRVETIRWMCAVRNREKYGKSESGDSKVSVETSFVIQQFGSGKNTSVSQEKEVVSQNRISKEN